MLTEEYIVILVTVPDSQTGEMVSRELLNLRLIACANIIPVLTSLYWWQGKLEKDKEVLLILKSRGDLLQEIIKIIKQKHPYSIPEIIALPIIGGNPDYLSWIKEETSGK